MTTDICLPMETTEPLCCQSLRCQSPCCQPLYCERFSNQPHSCQPEQVSFGKAVGHVISTVLLTLIVALAVAIYVIPRFYGGSALAIDSGSMTPTLATGDMVAVRHIEPSEIEMGDIITYSTKNALITHRVVGIGVQGDQAMFLTQGDANSAVDPPVLAEQVRGKVMYSIPMLGMGAGWVRGHLHWVMVGAGVLWLASFIHEKASERRACPECSSHGG